MAQASATTTIAGTVSPLLASATDLGAVPASQPVTGVVIQLQTTAAQQAALQQYAAAVMMPGSAQYRQWLTQGQFAAQFGATPAEVSAVTAWLTAAGMQVSYTAQGAGFVVASGTAAQVERALGVQLERYALADGTSGFANTTDPELPATVAGMVATVHGLSSFAPVAIPQALAVQAGTSVATTLDAAGLAAKGLNGSGVALTLTTQSELSAAQSVAPMAAVNAAAGEDSLLAAAMAIDGNGAAVLHVGGGCAAAMSAAEMAWFEQVALQANVQGVTLVASTADCAGGAAFPATLGEVTAVGRLSAAANGAFTALRPGWQSVTGLAADGLRHVPDVQVSDPAGASDAAAFAGAMTLVVQKAGARQGNVNAILYGLALQPGVYSQTAAPGGLTAMMNTGSTGSYDALGGLGTPDIQTMLQLWPLGSTQSYVNVQSSPSNITYGQSTTITATITPTSPTPTGSVTFTYPGGTQQVGLSGNTATLTLSSLTAGSNSFTANYSGDSNYAAGSATGSVYVQQESTSLTTTPSGTPVIGVSFPVTVTVAGSTGSGSPTGKVTVTPQGVSNSTGGSFTMTSADAGMATINVTLGQAGSFTLTTQYAGDTNFSSSNQSTQVTVATGASTTVLSYSPDPPTAGMPITLSAAVTGSVTSPTPTGTVTFYDGATMIATGSLTSGVATGTATLTPGKTHLLTAKYAGDTNFAGSTSTAVSAAGGTIATAVGLTASTYAVTYGQPVIFTATVGAASGITTSLTPTGSVQFYNSSTNVLLGTATLASGVATFTSSSLPVGLQSITATYLGDTNFAGSTSTVYNGVTVTAGTGVLTAVISPTTNVPYGATASVTATLTLSGGGTPSGTITATVPGSAAQGGGTYSGVLVGNAGGSATANITVNAPPPGNYTITVNCPTNTVNYTCASTTVTLSTTKGETTTTVSALPTAPLAGQVTQLSAVVADAGAGTLTYTFTGTVTFYDNGAAIGSAAVIANQASTSVTFKASAVHSITAIYSGDTYWYGSTSPAIVVTAAANPTTTTLNSNLSTALVGTNLILTATVGGTSGSTVTSVPTGSVTFYDTYNNVVATLGTSPLLANGPYSSMATLTTNGLQGGTHSIFAIYAGDTVYSTSTSSTLAITEQDYSLTFLPSTLTLARGSPGTVTILLSSVGGFTGSIDFGCTPPPDTETTCTISPGAGSAGGTTTMYIGTTAPSAVKGGQTAKLIMLLPVSAAALLVLLPLGRRRIGIGLVVLLLAAGLANIGCTNVNVGTGSGSGSGGGTGGGGGGTDPGTPLGTNNFTVTSAGTSTGTGGTYVVRHSTTFSVTVQ